MAEVESEATEAIWGGGMPGAGLVTSSATTQETILTREYPLVHDLTNEPYHPTVFGNGMALDQKYKLLAKAEHRRVFLGRLATCR